MRAVIIFAVVKIMEVSRFNLNNPSMTRTAYDLLSLALLAAICAGPFLERIARFDAVEAKVEAFVRSRRSLRLLLLLALAGFLLYETWRYADVLYAYPVRCLQGDMLINIRGAAESMAALSSPFDKTFCPWNVPFAYFPMMMLYYLPAVLLRFDLRLVSYLFFLLTLGLIYRYHRDRGRPLGGALIVLILVSSELFRFHMISVQDFPFLFVVALAVYGFAEKRDVPLFLGSALALATRQVFVLLVPFLAIAVWKYRRPNFRRLAVFGAGLVVGFLPAILYPGSFVGNLFRMLSYYRGTQKPSHLLTHSLGLSYYFVEKKLAALVLCVVVFAALYALALRFLRERSLCLFLGLGLAAFLYLESYATRPEEYYFLPLFAVLALAPLRSYQAETPGGPARTIWPLTVAGCLGLLLTFPVLSPRGMEPRRLRGEPLPADPGCLQASGWIEFSLPAVWPGRAEGPLTLVLRRVGPETDVPAKAILRVNDRDALRSDFVGRELRLDLDRDFQREYLIWGANAFDVRLEKSQPFRLKVVRRRD